MDISDGMDKSWDHPWTTEEMRKKRREWSLAGDAGLLKHLQQFSDNLMAKANKTEEALDSLATQLNETAILIDNVTNKSLALANTQFIESRVQEDDVEIEKKVDSSILQESKVQDLAAEEIIASVTESVKQGLRIMDEKYKQMEFVDSDSEEEEEEEDNRVVLSVVLGPNNPYQDRPLPYVIGSEKWKNSTKIGLESSSSSSSESEQIDEEEESESDGEDTTALRDFNMGAAPKTNVAKLLPPIGATDYNKRSDIAYMDNDKLDVISQNNVNSASESITPNDNVPKVSLPNDSTPNFAEELAKRLGTVRQAQKPFSVDEKSEASINRFKDDLFTPEGDDDALSDNSKNIFSVNDKSSENLWKEKPLKPMKHNIIPASIDVPPPICTVSTKPKSAIDDLFADADSEDSDDIFLSKNAIKTVSKNVPSNSSNHTVSTESAQKKYLNIVAPSATKNIVTSTPEANVNTSNLFSDDEDDSDLFRPSKNQLSNKKKPVGGVSILGNILNSDVENKLSSRLSRKQSSGSDSNTTVNYENSASNEPVPDSSRNTMSNGNNDQSSVVMARNNADNLIAANESSYSSGISIQASSINNTDGSSLGVDFQPQMTSTRLKSEEIYRERVASDSLFTARTRNPVNANSNSTISQRQEEQNENVSSVLQDDVFENEDLFGPPPLPKANSKQTRSKVVSLFDDSDSGDELFSTASSGSRSQKSTDFLTTASQYTDKTKSAHRKGLFDEDIDIFGNKDSPDVDIFGVTSKSVAKEDNTPDRKLPTTPENAPVYRDTIPKNNSVAKGKNITSKKISLFDDDDDDVDDGDLFAAKPIKNENPVKNQSRLFSDSDGNDLFAAKKDEKQLNAKDTAGTTATGIDNVDKNRSAREVEGKGSDFLPGSGLFSATTGSRGLIFEDDDYDDLFAGKSMIAEKKKGNEQPTSEKKNDMKIQEKAKDVEESLDANIFSKESQGSNTVSDPTSIKVEQSSGTDTQQSVSNINTMENVENEQRKSPPKTLSISIDVSSSSPEESNQAGRRAVSGKIKNLMGKMGDLKILSPMDTPPLWKRSEEKTDEEDSIADRDSDDGGCISTQGHSSPPSVSEDSITHKQSQQSTVSTESNVESAISFDEPAQVETLSTAASKTRVRIQAKRRPQSRHARKTALRQSGIDFDTVDAGENNSQDDSGKQSSNTVSKERSSSAHVNTANSDHFISTTNDNLHRITDTNNYLAADDKSELGSISKESSMSANKNTLLSPSTDEEDLFDVPPDLPEDPQKEDTLFGRAPILSPVDKVLSEKAPPSFKPLKNTHIERTDNIDGSVEESSQSNKSNKLNASTEPSNDSVPDSRIDKIDNISDNNETKDESEQVVDPLRDNSHDPLKDPSHLFAFVTKTPSPEKGKNMLFAEDDSLFSSGRKKSAEEQTAKKPVLDLFADDTEGDLFSATLSKPVKKPLKDTKISLFDDSQDDEDDSLFGSISKKSSVKVSEKKEPEKQSGTQQPRKKISLFGDDDNDTNLFSDQTEQTKSDTASVSEQSNKNEIFTTTTEPVKTSHITDIFADQSSGDDDIFATKPLAKKIVTSKSLFPSDDEDDDSNQIFGKKISTSDSKIKSTEIRSTIKKPVTKDLKKTAEKINEDPLSVFQDD